MISVSQFKMFLMTQSCPREYGSGFVDSLKGHINPFVLEKLNQLDGYVVLSSATPMSYLEHVADVFGVKFDQVIGSHVCGGVLVDNYSENKVQALHEAIHVANNEVLFTYHHMDLPLMKVSDEAFLVNPSKRTIRKADREGVKYNILQV